MAAANILLVDDDLSTIQAVQPLLSQEGYRVICLHPGSLALRRVVDDPPRLVLLGINDGAEDWRFCHQLLHLLDAPLLLLLASDRELDRVKGLSLGAADCVSKSAFSTLELLARIGAVLRRDAARAGRQPAALTTFVDGDLVVDLEQPGREVCLDGRPVALTPIELRILACCLQHVGQELTPEELLLETWGPGHGRT
ncbi:MAG TPA: response regulator transcription factor, partial [Anaerolineae bacterium]|nr:response regulator transcription factor [Anaerolineae bacterium]